MTYSIITVNYNNAKGLEETIQSVKEQSCHDYEFIVIDGGSTDDSKDILKYYSSDITYWVSEKDLGIYNGMNKGILKANGDYINFMNSGDTYYTSGILEEVKKKIDGSDIIVGCDYNEDPITKASAITTLPTRVTMATFFVGTFPHQSTFIRRKLFEGNLYDENLKIVADWKFFLERIVYDNRTVKLLKLPVCKREQEGISSRQFSKMKSERENVLLSILPPGIYSDYKSLSHLDITSINRLLEICDNPRQRRFLKIFIKLIIKLHL